jgi:dihydrofolate synthase/folylpolyglutamate synthase
MKSIAEAAGLKPHVYTSPHLVRFSERIRPQGRKISEDHLTALLEACETANDGKPITFFEITTAAAFLAFARAPADITLLETGLGGKLDATNVIARPQVTIITPVSLDHQHFLGTRLTDIAGEKAGILKSRVPVVIGPQHAFAARVITARARALHAPSRRWGHDFHARIEDDTLIYRDRDGDMALPLPGLAGDHQTTNGAMAIAALKLLGNPLIDTGAISKGLKGAKWPARLQRLDRGAMLAPLHRTGFEIWLDGGHNPAAGRALAHTFKAMDKRPFYLIVAMVMAKDAAGFIKPLAAARPKGLWALSVPGDHPSLEPARIATLARRAGIAAHETDSVKSALTDISRRPPGRVLITGSLYLAGAVLEQIGGGRSRR